MFALLITSLTFDKHESNLISNMFYNANKKQFNNAFKKTNNYIKDSIMSSK